MALRWREDDGQAAVELVALLPVLAVVLAAGWQLAVAGHALWAADGAARAAARAAAVGGDARVAARAALPPGLRPGLTVRPGGDGRVAVSARIPRVLGLPSLGSVSASARFRPQR
jgi:hypothetical protein